MIPCWLCKITILLSNSPPNLPSKTFTKTVKICLAVLTIAVVLASIQPLHFPSYWLHQAGTLVCVGVFLYLKKVIGLSDKAFVGGTLFLLIHIIGARYLYSYTPYSEWTQAVFGFSLDKVMGWQRNMYDRLVHFCYGLCLFGVFFDIIQHYFKNIGKKQVILLVLMLNMSTSLVYEWIEWALAMTMSPEQAEAYNGQQGDMWDAHKDMFLAFLGGIINLFTRLEQDNS